MKTLRERFNEAYCPEPFSGCWLWTGSVSRTSGNPFAYGMISHRLAHRVAWELYRFPIPEGLLVLHQCDTPLCVNPDHLSLGTQADNMLDMASKNRNPGTRTLTVEQVRFIKSSPLTCLELAKQFQVTYKAIHDIIAGITWKHIKKAEAIKKE